MMKKTIYVVAARTGARLLLQVGANIALLEEIEHPEGRLRDGDRDSDRGGRTHDSTGTRHALSRHETAHDHLAAVFARVLAARLAELRIAKKYDEAVLIAEPRFLGMLSAELDEPTSRKVRHKVTKDLSNVRTSDLGEHFLS